MKISGMLSGNNDVLNSVMSQQSQSDSYAERAMEARKVATTMRQQEMGKASVGQLQTNAKEDAENIDEAISKAAEQKKEADKIEAQRIAQKQASGSSTAPATSTGDTVTISPEGQEAAKNVTVAVTPAPAQPTLQVAPTQVAPVQSAPMPSAPVQTVQAAPTQAQPTNAA